MVSFENFVKSMPPSLSELKVTPSFCFPFKIRDDPTASNKYISCENYLVQKYIKLTFFKAVEVRQVCQKPNRICTQKPYYGVFFHTKERNPGFSSLFL